MKCLVTILLFITLIQFTVQNGDVSNVNATEAKNNKSKLFDNFGDELSKLVEKIHDKFDEFKEQIKLFFEREKRQNPQNIDPALGTLVRGTLRDNVGFRTGLRSSPNARVIDRVSNAALRVSQNIANDFNDNFRRQQSGRVSSNFRFNNDRPQVTPVNDGFNRIVGLQAPSDLCPFKRVGNCDPSAKFRRFDGSCNNLQNPWWGKNEIPYKRYLTADYADGIDRPKALGKSGKELPNARLISRTLCVDNGRTEAAFSHILALFGQFLAHDITSVSTTTDDRGAIVDCPCGSRDPACLSITVPPGDQLIRSSCIKFTRSSAAFPTVDCRLGVREQLNLISSFIDATQVYGTDDQANADLRSRVGGQLQTTPGVNKRPFLKQGNDGSCRDTNAQVRCFVGGEGRTNENLGLLSLQTLFLRAHNKIAQNLATINPTWNDERLFQETRRIVIAVYQHIVYNEYLPTVLGLQAASSFDLVAQPTDTFYSGYDSNVNPSIANEFAAAAFRFGHTLIRNSFSRADQSNQMGGAVNLGDMTFRPVEAYNARAGGIDSLLIGLINDPASKFDTSFVDTMQNHLFEFRLQNGETIAVDLAATNINRGRDHGIPSYNAYRERCGLRRATSFQELSDTIEPQQLQQLSQLYDSPDDIDLYIGGLSERPTLGAVVGPVFGCLIASQFNDLKKGDRYYYENGPSDIGFTLEQLHEIKQMSLSKLICENSDIDQIQPNAFILASPQLRNGRVSCSSLPMMDLRAWASSN